MLHYHQKTKKIGLDPGVRPASQSPFSSQVRNYLYSAELVTDKYLQHITSFLPTLPCLDTAMTTLRAKSFLSAGNRLILKTRHFNTKSWKTPAVPVPETQCQVLSKHTYGNVTFLSLPDHKYHQLPKAHRPLAHLVKQQSVEETENERLLKITTYLMSSA